MPQRRHHVKLLECTGRGCYSDIMRLLGIDPGQKRIGLAIAEPETRIALPHRTLDRQSLNAAVGTICEIIQEKGVDAVVIGHPLRLDGTRGIAARRAEEFAKKINGESGVEVHLWDERYSSEAASRGLRAAGVRGTRSREVIDQAAATLILQSYLDAHGSPS